MKNIIKSQSKLVVAAILLFALLSTTNSCKKSSDSPGANEVYIENMAFNPSTITVAANTTISWTNKDGVSHTVTSATGLFNSGTIANNGVYSHTFTTAGTYSYSCTIHPDMVGSVVVNATQTGGTGY